MYQLLLCITIFMSVAYAYDCEECKRDIAKQQGWADDAIRQGRVPQYINPNQCDHLCSEEWKKKNGIKTDAQIWADQRMNSEMFMRGTMQQYQNTLSDKEKIVYNFVKNYIVSNLPTQRNICTQQNMQYMGYGMNVNFMVQLCLVEALRDVQKSLNYSNFVNLMNRLEVPKVYWEVADAAIGDVIGDIASSMY